MEEEARRPVPWKPISAVLLAVVVVLAAISVFQFVTRPVAEEELPVECPPGYDFDTVTRTCVLADQVAPNGISSASTDIGTVGSPITFDGSGSTDNVAVTEWRWAFGDGTEGSGRTVQKVYYTPGSYVISLTVKDAAGNVGNNEARLTRVSAVLDPDPTDQPAGNATTPVAFLGLDQNVVRTTDTVTADVASSWIWRWNEADGQFRLAQNDSAAFQGAWNLTTSLDWGDATPETTAGTATHSYSVAGNYAVRLTATGWNGISAYAISTVHVLEDPGEFPGVVKNPDTFVWATISAARDLDPGKAYDSSSGNIIRSVYEPLVTWDRDSLVDMVPILAAAVPTVANGGISTDGLTYTFDIRPGVRFTNGDTLDAFDVEYTLERNMLMDFAGGPMSLIMDPLLNRSSIDASSLSDAELLAIGLLVANSVTAVDADTVRFTLQFPFAAFLATLAGWGIQIMSKEFLIDERNQWDIDATGAYLPATIRAYNRDIATYGLQEVDDMVGTGPYELVSWDRDVEYVLVANDDYWQGPASVTNVVVKNIPEWGTRKLLLLNGDADWGGVPSTFRDQVLGAEGIQAIEGFLDLAIDYTAFNFNTSNVPANPLLGSGTFDVDSDGTPDGIPPNFFADQQVRRAFSWLFDYDTYIDEVIQGQGIQPFGPVPKGMLGYTDTGPRYSLDIAKATSEFENSTMWPNLMTHGFKVTYLYNEGNVGRQIGGEIIRDTLAAINPKFIMVVQSTPFSVIIGDLIAGRLPIFGGGWGADYPDPHNFMHPFMRSEVGFWAGFMNYKNATVDMWIDQALQETDQAIRQGLYEDIQEANFWDPPGVWRSQPIVTYFAREWVTGFYFNPITMDANNVLYFYDLSKG